MANIPSVAKRARQAERRRARNAPVRSALKTHQRKLRESLAAGGHAAAAATFRELSSKLDKAVKRGVIHKNSANRKKSAFAKALAASAKTAATAPAKTAGN
ncbi:MAG: 30S ribosomal protein S20 [Terrimicrobiaceae bacterium]|nr:30S ribosomal protein S20 [Terrimicrobiaceae bacterium]